MPYMVLLIFLLAFVRSQYLECPQFTCKPASLPFADDTCIYYDNSTYFLRPCPNGYMCPPIYTPGNSTCQLSPIPSLINTSWPGEPCINNSTCAFGYCENEICVGKHWLENCKSSDECDAGLYCKNKKCWPQLPVNTDGCTQDEECENDAGCFVWASEPIGTCVKYFTLPRHDMVFNCHDYMSYFCESGTCVGGGGEGKSLCVNKVETKYLGFECETDSDCPGKNDDWRFYGQCQCSLSHTGKRYCQPFLGDYDGRNYFRWLKAWYESTDLKKCNTMRREAPNCMKQWSDYPTYLYYFLHFNEFASIHGNDNCVKEIYNYAYWQAKNSVNPDSDDSALILLLVNSLILFM